MSLFTARRLVISCGYMAQLPPRTARYVSSRGAGEIGSFYRVGGGPIVLVLRILIPIVGPLRGIPSHIVDVQIAGASSHVSVIKGRGPGSHWPETTKTVSLGHGNNVGVITPGISSVPPKTGGGLPFCLRRQAVALYAGIYAPRGKGRRLGVYSPACSDSGQTPSLRTTLHE